ncbi:hypothetical protein BDZ90DRAFT_263255 [Jaminaea rosea]|uniref:Uncharacterized protein n=1 Tax=Jaminaea rosea TaxID=1569628 RepID=A0A316UGN2_9BASI|nr:hypothetical protein BDZ90DRAFT_263255 [Jaminaea rosea]PWN24409.1 hypothetical protein BDZ90DRAFT_263255 [Jaminaea rosea]
MRKRVIPLAAPEAALFATKKPLLPASGSYRVAFFLPAPAKVIITHGDNGKTDRREKQESSCFPRYQAQDRCICPRLPLTSTEKINGLPALRIRTSSRTPMKKNKKKERDSFTIALKRRSKRLAAPAVERSTSTSAKRMQSRKFKGGLADSLEWDEHDEAGSEAEFCGAGGHDGEVEADDEDGDAEEEDEEAEEEEDGQVAGQKRTTSNLNEVLQLKAFESAWQAKDNPPRQSRQVPPLNAADPTILANFNEIVATSNLKLRNKALLEAANTISSAQRRSAVKTLDDCGLGEHRRKQRQEQTRGANKGAASA